MKRGWEVELCNGQIMQEAKYSWRDVPNKDIKRFELCSTMEDVGILRISRLISSLIGLLWFQGYRGQQS